MERSHFVLLSALTLRSHKSLAAGGDGYVATGTLSFDAGLNTRAVRRVLDHAVACGHAERRDNGPGKSYSYRITEDQCS